MEMYNPLNQVYDPLSDGEKLLINLIVSVITSIESNINKEILTFDNIAIYKEDTGGFLNFAVYGNVTITTASNTYKLDNILLCRVPRLTNISVYMIKNLPYFCVMKEKLSSNIPVCKKYLDSKNMYKYECYVKVENHDSLETRDVSINSGKDGIPMLISVSQQISYKLSDLLHSMQPREVLEEALRCMYVTDLVTDIILSLYDQGTIIDYMPGIIPACRHYGNISNHNIIILGQSVQSEYMFILYMVVRYYMMVADGNDSDDLDDYFYKSVDNCARLMCMNIRHRLKKFTSRNISTYQHVTNALSERLLDCLRSNKWSVSKDRSELKLSRFTDNISSGSLIVHSHEIILSSGSYTSTEDSHNPRYNHISQLGFVCINKTSDDQHAGLRKYLASDCIISKQYHLNVDEGSWLFNNYIEDYEILVNETSQMSGDFIIMERLIYTVDKYNYITDFLYNIYVDTMDLRHDMLWYHNCNCIGYFKSKDILLTLDRIKFGMIGDNAELSWYIKDNIIHSRLYHGRYIAISKLSKAITMDMDIICMVDTSEYNRLINFLDNPLSEVGVLHNNIPYANHNPPPRNMLGGKNTQNAIAEPSSIAEKIINLPGTKFNNTIKMSNIYSQRPLVITEKGTLMTNGTNVVVFVCTFGGNTIEDAVVVNRRSVDLGLFNTEQYFTITWDNTNGRYKMLNFMVYKKIGEMVGPRDIILELQYQDIGTGEIINKEMLHDKQFECRLVSIYTDGPPKDMYGNIINNYPITELKVELYRMKRLENGDKLSSGNGQKAVVIIMNDIDLPVSENPCYTTPDIILSPLSLMGRSTIAQSLSMVAGNEVLKRYGIATNLISSGYSTTIFSCKVKTCLDNIMYNLLIWAKDSTGTYRQYGDKHPLLVGDNIPLSDFNSLNTVAYDGMTGQMIDCSITAGVTYYLALGHLTDTKVKVGVTSAGELANNVRYNWQEIISMMHQQATNLMHHIYEGEKQLMTVSYCGDCYYIFDKQESKCPLCSKIVTTKIVVTQAVMDMCKILTIMNMRMNIFTREDPDTSRSLEYNTSQ